MIFFFHFWFRQALLPPSIPNNEAETIRSAEKRIAWSTIRICGRTNDTGKPDVGTSTVKPLANASFTIWNQFHIEVSDDHSSKWINQNSLNRLAEKNLQLTESVTLFWKENFAVIFDAPLFSHCYLYNWVLLLLDEHLVLNQLPQTADSISAKSLTSSRIHYSY